MSTFQRLPTVVVSRIFDYLNISIISDSRDSCDNEENGAHFLSLSSIWREAAQRVFCHTAVLSCITDSYVYKSSFDINKNAGNPTYDYIFDKVQCIKLAVGESDIMDRHYLSNKSTAFANELQFKNAHTIMLTIWRDDEYDAEYENNETIAYFNNPSEMYEKSLKRSLRNMFISNIKEFIGWAIRIAPNVKNVEIGLGEWTCRYKSSLENYAKHVFDLFDHGSFSSLKIMHPTYDWDIKQQLSELRVNWLGNYNNCSEIIQRNAGMLNSLSIMFQGEEGFGNVWDIFGYHSNIVYPNLHKLHLDNQVHEWVNSAPSIEIDSDYAPFPALRYLKTSGNYAITDRVIFRGNEKTLISIDVVLHRSWLHVVRFMLIHRSCERIKYMRFKLKPFEQFTNDPLSSPILEQLVAELPSSLAKLCFKGNNPLPTCLLAAEQYSRFSQLQQLKFEHASLNLDLICQIAEANPKIVEIHGNKFLLDPQLKHRSLCEIVNSLNEKYKLTDVRLSYVHILAYAGDGFVPPAKSDIIRCNDVLAKLFPRLREIRSATVYHEIDYSNLLHEV